MFRRSASQTVRSILGVLLGLAVAVGCSQGARNRSDSPPESGRQRDRGTGQQDNKGTSAPSGTQLWLFGTAEPDRTKPFDARGVRMILDLRTLNVKGAVDRMATFADRGLGLAVCVRWSNPVHEGDKARGREDYDVPPTPEESARALSQLSEMVSSAPARRLGKNLYIQIYNEIGGGPGRFNLETTDELLAFATRAARKIREANPDVQICGPAVSGNQLNQSDRDMNTPGLQEKAEVIRRCIKWTAQNADVADVHLNGQSVDDLWADRALKKMRQLLDAAGGTKVGLISLEWSCSGYPDRNDAAGVRKYIHTLWDTMNRNQVRIAAYTYWPLVARPDEIRDRTGWASVMDDQQRPNRPVYDALVEIGKGKSGR